MSKDRPEAGRGYPPDYVSAETLAYRLDCEVETIEALMRRGALPRPTMIGSLKRWDFAAVRMFVDSQNRAKRLAINGRSGPEDDAFLAALEQAPAKEKM
jgi:predicted DNA-binding transcriptional regulator AlpA